MRKIDYEPFRPEIERLYIVEKLSITKVGEILGINGGAARRRLNLPFRNRQDSLSEFYKSKSKGLADSPTKYKIFICKICGREYVYNYTNKNYCPKCTLNPPFCQCGCGKRVNRCGSRYLPKHYEYMKGRHFIRTEEFGKKISKLQKERWDNYTPEERLDKIKNWQRRHGVSKPQQELYNYFKRLFPDAELDKVISTRNGKGYRKIDVAIPSLKIGIEYDGYYWHIGKENESKKRDEELAEVGWEILHIQEPERKRRKDNTVELRRKE